MIEKLKECYFDAEEQSNLDWFREGIRIGLSLMMEVL